MADHDSPEALPEQPLAEAAELLRLSIDHMPLAYVLRDPNLVVREWNRAAERTFGYRRDEVLGTRVHEILASPGVRARVEEAMERMRSGEAAAFYSEGNVICKDGAAITCRWHNTVVRDREGKVLGFVSMVEDVTEQVASRHELAESHAKLVAVVESTDDKILLSDGDAKPVFFNTAYATGIRELLDLDMRPGVQPHKLLPPAQRDHWDACHRRVLAGERFVSEFAHEVAPGDVRVFETSWGPVVAEGQVRGFTEVTREITERRRAEAERQTLDARVARAEKLESLGVLAGGVAHDFNNLLMGVLGHAELARMRIDADSPATPHITEIVRAARKAADLAAQMLASSGRRALTLEPVHIAGVAEEAVELLEHKIPEATTITCSSDTDVPPVLADRTQMGQVVMNLVLNAAEAIDEGPGSIRLRVSAMDCDGAYLSSCYVDDGLPEGRYVVLEVSDDGRGMDDETRAKMFEPFFTTKFTGRGLGLAALLGIVRMHSGAIRVQTDPGKGTTVRVLLPAHTPA